MRLFYLCLVTCLTMASAQSKFKKGMQKAFELWQSNQTEAAENMFERIATAEPQQWLPHYYIAQINSLKSWNEKDEAVLKAQLDKAQLHIGKAMAISKNNVEIIVMQAQILTNWVVFDGATYGMKYATKITEMYNKANLLNPANPRAAFFKTDWAMGSAKYFGQDTAPYCKAIKSSLKLFDTFKPKTAFHPNWGKKRAMQIAESCDKK